MKDLDQIWKAIDAEFDQDEDLELDSFFESRKIEGGALPGSIADAASEMLQATFSGDELPPDLKQSKYVIKQQLNTGGQSEIYLAERSDGVYQKTVIIKIMSRRHRLDAMRDAFKLEMQLLADLSHPGIVQIIDGGVTEDDQPWLVLEHIEGPQLGSYCEQNQLDEKQIVQLFLNICEALRFIHVRGVVHKDLKAANVMVRVINGVPWPVIIDFGIALETAAQAAGPGGTQAETPVFGTRGFSAPEQIAGHAVDHRADIYSTGMMLTQLLIGDAVENIGILDSREREALLRKKGVSADLVQVIRKATQENPDQRYQDTEALRSDLHYWLNDYPLADNRSRSLHVIGKTMRRHKLISAATALVLAAAAVFTFKYTTDVRELQTLTRAEKNAGDAVYNFMLTDLFDHLTRIGRIDLLSMTAERSLERLANQEPRTFNEASWLQSAIAYINVGKVFDALESSQQALEAYSRAESYLDEISESPSLRRDYLRHLASLHVLKSLTLTTSDQRTEMESSLRRAIDLSTELIAHYPDEKPDALWEANLQLGWHYMEYDQPDEALQHIESAIDISSRQTGQTSDPELHARWQKNYTHSLQALAWYAFDYGNESDAAEAIDRAVELAQNTLAEDENDIEYLDNYRILRNHQSFFNVQLRRMESAEESVEEAIRAGRQLALMAPQNRKYQRELSYSYTTRGELAERQGDMEEALAYFQQSLAISREIAADDPEGFSSSNDLAIDLISNANVLNALGHKAQARTHWEEAIEVMRPVHQQEPDNKYYSFSLAVPLIQLQRYEEARPLIEAIRGSGMDDEVFQTLLAQHGLD